MQNSECKIKNYTDMANKVLLMILDGWGIGNHTKSDAIYSTNPEFINALTAANPHAELRTDGENVGLPDGQMGNSEVGHLNMGAGRIVYQDLTKITKSIQDGDFFENEALLKAEKIENNRETLERNMKIFKRKLKLIIEQQMAVVEEIEVLELEE